MHQQTPSKTCSSLAAVSTCQPLFSELLSGGRTLNHSSATANIKGDGRMVSGKLKSAEVITLSLMATLFPRPAWDSFNLLL